MGKLDGKAAVVTGSSDLAQSVIYAVTQPPSVHVDEVLVRPSVGMTLGGQTSNIEVRSSKAGYRSGG